MIILIIISQILIFNIKFKKRELGEREKKEGEREKEIKKEIKKERGREKERERKRKRQKEREKEREKQSLIGKILRVGCLYNMLHILS